MSEYAGANWIRRQLDNYDICIEMSILGCNVADLLGELFRGIYHLDHKALFNVDWSNERCIEFTLSNHDLATTDFDELTRLVFLAHHFAIRVSIEACHIHRLRLLFFQRYRGDILMDCHPTLDQAVNKFKLLMAQGNIPEYSKLNKEK